MCDAITTAFALNQNNINNISYCRKKDQIIRVKQKRYPNSSGLSMNMLSKFPKPYIYLLITNNKLQTKSKEEKCM